MGTDLITTMTDHTAKTFWGGDDRGVCVQITKQKADNDQEYIQLTMEEAAALTATLHKFIADEAVRRQTLLREQLVIWNRQEKTVFSEVASLSCDFLVVRDLALRSISLYCPKTKGAEA